MANHSDDFLNTISLKDRHSNYYDEDSIAQRTLRFLDGPASNSGGN